MRFILSQIETVVTPYLNILSDFRDSVRSIARSINSKDILVICDKLRDETLPDNGVRLEDIDGKPTAIKFVGREAILRERNAKAKAEADKLAEKERKKKEQEQARIKKEELKKVHPKDLFKLEIDKYSEFDENVNISVLCTEFNCLNFKYWFFFYNRVCRLSTIWVIKLAKD